MGRHFEKTGHRHPGSTFDDQPMLVEYADHGAADFLLVHQHPVVDQGPAGIEGDGTRFDAAGRAIREGIEGLDVQNPPRPDRCSHDRRVRRQASHDPGRFAQSLYCPGDPGDQPTAAHRRHDAVHLGQTVHDFQPDCPLPAHHERIVVRGNVYLSGFLCQPAGVCFGHVAGRSVKTDLGTQVLEHLHLQR